MKNWKWWLTIVITILFGLGGWYSFVVKSYSDEGHALLNQKITAESDRVSAVEEGVKTLDTRMNSVEKEQATDGGKIDLILQMVQAIDRRLR